MSKVVLIVDDEPANIDVIKGLLPPDIKCKAAIKGEAALKQIDKNAPDIVILDLIMPGMDGQTVLKNIREQNSSAKLPVIIVSGEEDISKRQELDELGISGFVKKPINANEFQQCLNTLL